MIVVNIKNVKPICKILQERLSRFLGGYTHYIIKIELVVLHLPL